MKKTLIIFSFFLLGNVGCTLSDPEMMELLQEIKAQNDKLLQEVEAMKGQLSLLDGKYQVILASLADNKKELEALKSQIDALKAQIAQQLIKIDQLSAQLTQQGADIVKLSAEIAELKASIEELKGLIEELLSGKSPVPTNGLVAWYPFNGNANDDSGNGFTGTVNGATLTTNRLETANSAYAFNGSNGHITANGNQRFVSPQMTTSAWVLFNQLSSGGLQYLVLGNITNAAWAYSYRFPNNSNNLLKNQGCGLRVDHDWANTFSPNKWYHVVYVISDTAISSYVNGVFISSQPSAPFKSECSSYILNIGLDVFGGNEYLNGKMDDIAIWDRALTPDEILKIYKGENF
jgi:cell division protein FtsB